MPFVLKLLTTALAKKLLLGVAEVLVKRTDNKLDDEFLAVVKQAVEAA